MKNFEMDENAKSFKQIKQAGKWLDYSEMNTQSRNNQSISLQTTEGFASEDFTIPDDETYTRN